jgi:hypothetical protein
MRNIKIVLQRLSLYAFAVVLIFFSSCSGKKRVQTDIVIALEKNLLESNTVINNSTSIAMKALYDKSVDFCTEERAKIWLPKAELVINNSKKLYDHIENIRNQKEFDHSVLDTLTRKLKSFKQIILSADSSIMAEFADHFNFTDQFIFLADNASGKEISNTSVSSLLTLLQNNIKIIENKTIAFCNAKVGCTVFWFDSYSPIISQSNSILQAGDVLEIKAGIGAYSKKVQPLIKIDGMPLELNEEGFALYKLKTSKPPGKYKIPVKISFVNPNTGKNETNDFNVEYTVAQPCNQ